MATDVSFVAVGSSANHTGSDEATGRIAYAGFLLAVAVVGAPGVIGLATWAVTVALGDLGLDNETLRTFAAWGSVIAGVGALALAPAAIVGRKWAPEVTRDGHLGVYRALTMSAFAVLVGDVLTAGALSFIILVGGGILAAPIAFVYAVVVGGAVLGAPAFGLGLIAIYVWSRLLPHAVGRIVRP